MARTETAPAVLGEEEAAVPVGELVAFGLAMQRANEALAAALRRAETAETELGELADRIGDAVRAAVTAERERIRGLAAESQAVCLEPCEDGPSCAHGDHARPFAGLIGEAPGG